MIVGAGDIGGSSAVSRSSASGVSVGEALGDDRKFDDVAVGVLGVDRLDPAVIISTTANRVLQAVALGGEVVEAVGLERQMVRERIESRSREMSVL